MALFSLLVGTSTPPVTCSLCLCTLCMQTFVDAAILAYECGMNEDSLRHELKVYKASLEQQVAPPGMVSVLQPGHHRAAVMHCQSFLSRMPSRRRCTRA